MIISSIYPQYIFIDDEQTLQLVLTTFDLTDYQKSCLKIGEWFKTTNSNTESVYIVKPADTFKSVAQKLNISEEKLKAICKTKNLYVGQKIEINI